MLDDVEERTAAVLGSISGEAAAHLCDRAMPHCAIVERITEALQPRHGLEKAHDIAFHLSDWIADAAFLLALHVNPEAFTPEEIAEEVEGVLIHAPNHLMAAAHLAESDMPLTDIWNLGIRVEPGV